jgi:hypothetical protein
MTSYPAASRAAAANLTEALVAELTSQQWHPRRTPPPCHSSRWLPMP